MHSSYTDVPASLTDVLYSYVLKNNNKNIVDNVATIFVTAVAQSNEEVASIKLPCRAGNGSTGETILHSFLILIQP